MDFSSDNSNGEFVFIVECIKGSQMLEGVYNSEAQTA